ncbi:MAG: glycosyltransferase family 2 protein [Candidatus Nanopusillus sp.]
MNIDISIIIPTLNEKENINELVERIKESLNDIKYEVIFVDDGSKDGTIEEIEKLKGKYKNIKIIERKYRKGLSSAFLDGVKNSNGKYIVLMDADLQHPPELLRKMYEKALEGYDLVIASRYVKGGKIENWNIIRELISKTAIFIAYIFLPETLKVKDPLSGYFLIKKELLNNFKISDPFSYKVLLDILVKVNYNKLIEIPYTFKERKHGKSKLDKKIIFSYLKQIFLLFNISQFIKFYLVGLSGIFINLLALYLLIFYFPFYISSFLAILISIIWNFILNDLFVFKIKKRKLLERFLLFFGGRSLLSKPVQYLSALLFYYIFGINYLISQLIAIFIAAIINWVFTKGIVYGK